MLIFLLILKIIGMILLVIACLIAVILFIPVFYELQADISKGSYTFRMHWLFHLVRFCFRYEKKMSAVLSILFIRIDFTDPEWKKKREKKKKQRLERKRKKAAKKRASKKEKERKKYLKEHEKNRSSLELDIEHEGKNDRISARAAGAESEGTADREEQIPGEKAVESAAVVEKEARGAGIHIPDGVRRIIDILRALYDSEIFGTVLPKLQLFLLRIRPRKLKGDLSFGLSDPAATGQILGVISMIPYLFQTELHICPDFESDRSYIEGNVYMRGRVHMIFPVVFAIRMIFDKNVRRFLRAVKKKN